MTREEAIDILMSANVWNDEERMAWEFLIPQLRESEDERIREAIEVAIRVYGKTQGEWIGGYDMDTLVVHLREAFGALEKQKDLDKMIVVSPEVWDNAISDAFENGKKEGEKQKENPKSADSIPADCVSDVPDGWMLEVLLDTDQSSIEECAKQYFDFRQ